MNIKEFELRKSVLENILKEELTLIKHLETTQLLGSLYSAKQRYEKAFRELEALRLECNMRPIP